MQFMKGVSDSAFNDIDEYKLKSVTKLQHFQKDKYDHVRRNIILLLDRLQKITDLYSVYYGHLDEEDRIWIDSDERLYRHFRFEIVNMTRYELVFLFKMLFEISSSHMIFKQITILLCDIDVAGQFSRGVPDMLRGKCKSSEEVLAEGVWSFDMVFSTMIPFFLLSFVFTNEMKRLRVIDRLGRNILKDRTDRQVIRVVSQLGIDDGITYLASTALLLLTLILKLEVSTLSESFIRTSLSKITTEEAKSLEYRCWVKNKSKKYSKKIGQLKSSVMTQLSMLTLCIKSRDMAVKLLLEKFETSTLKRQSIPKDLVSRINASTCRKEQMLLMMQCIGHVQSWSYKDAGDINRCLLDLHNAGEIATEFLHHATNKNYPIVKSITSPSWTQRSGDGLSINSLNTVSDIICICDILQFANAADHEAS
uniref:Uncharacterized protein n=1 Tax=Attheya septentrionalis TaxID=420275 RepID=A0A7S2U668_9STRA|mmetsp:Transcript_10499/g.19137  ORF Transcript_10499/g.19137 Transcript_10499/m.19137 type:complete len:422 (+) Transcript_10499:3-1268(+)